MEYKEKLTEVMNLVGYGLAKFDRAFAREFGCESKSAFCQMLVNAGLASSVRAVFNRQDSFDPYFDNGRRGWFQRNQREHIKLFIDSLFGSEDVKSFANVTKMYIHELAPSVPLTLPPLPPTMRSKFKQLQETGKEAEFYFLNNYRMIPLFASATLEDARLWGDGYDFQRCVSQRYMLAEVKGVRDIKGAVRMTQNEYDKAELYRSDFCLVVVSNLANTPKFTCLPDPLENMELQCHESQSTQKNYHSNIITW